VWAERRKWKKLSVSAFESDLSKSRLVAELDQLTSLSVDELAEVYDSELVSLIDKHCPVVKMRCRAGKIAPWFDAECCMSRRRSRMMERRYRKSKSHADRLTWIQQLKVTHSLYEAKRNNYWRSMIADNRGNTKKLWRTFSAVTG